MTNLKQTYNNDQQLSINY